MKNIIHKWKKKKIQLENLNIVKYPMKKNENEKCLFSNTKVFYIVITEHDLNKHHGLTI